MIEGIEWVTVMSILSTIVLGWRYVVTRGADAKILALEGKLAAQRAEGERFSQLLHLFQEQVKVNQSFTEALSEKERADEMNYRTLRALGDRNTAEIVDHIQKSEQRIPPAVGSITAEQIRTMTTEIVAIIHDAIGTRETVFPSLMDGRWERQLVIPRGESAYLFDCPRYSERKYPDEVFYVRSAESCWVIMNAAQGFHAVRRDSGVCGWVLDISVMMSEVNDDAKVGHGVIGDVDVVGVVACGRTVGSDSRAGADRSGGGDATSQYGNAGSGDSSTGE